MKPSWKTGATALEIAVAFADGRPHQISDRNGQLLVEVTGERPAWALIPEDGPYDWGVGEYPYGGR